MLIFRDARVCRARIVVITESRRGFKPGHWRETAARRRRAGGVHRRVPSADCTIVLDARLPRTLAGLLAGGALGLAGALMQTLTRNPLADPGILGVNNGASFAIVLGAALFGFSTPLEQLFMAFSGALIASLIVAFTGSQGGGQLSPVRLTLAGVALGAVLEGLTSGIALLNPEVYDQLRFWQAGSLDIRSLQTLKVALAPVVIAGIVALFLSRALNSLSLGSDTATALGSKVARTQLIGLLAITVLCGSATALVGPIAFIGLMMPHMARWLVGADHRWSLPVTLLATPALLLFADIIGRLLVPGELRVSVVSAFIGAPVLIFLVRRKSNGGGL
ncbi:iron-enterobactin transporter membrane protein [Salmonella enterica subsp. enterica serovar Javiana str. CFSAN001992]|nr:iron-enterobactin transporter membrane protein [Salmonella enterica subsp. enterica serovar Javiana str. CFSAN001992]